MVKKKKIYKNKWSLIKKGVEPRKIFLIQNRLPYCHFILDVGSGAGIYIPYLSQKAKHIVALDINQKNHLEVSKKDYEFVLADARSLPFRDGIFDALWASEIIEHFESLKCLDELERVTNKTILITVPNPLSPHFKRDPTHILKYSVIGLEKFLKNRSKKSAKKYVIRGLGFDEIPIPKIIKMFTTFATWFIPILSPTIAIIGVTKE